MAKLQLKFMDGFLVAVMLVSVLSWWDYAIREDE